MTRGDDTIETGADKLDELGAKAAAKGGLGEKLGAELSSDAAFLRKLKPSLVLARVRGELPKDGSPARPLAPNGPQLGARAHSQGEGPNPFAVAAGAFAVGWIVAKIVDWRGHAHPKL